MKLWVTPDGDKWLCDECFEEFKKQAEKEEWRAAFEKWDPMLRCSECKHGDVEIFDQARPKRGCQGLGLVLFPYYFFK